MYHKLSITFILVFTLALLTSQVTLCAQASNTNSAITDSIAPVEKGHSPKKATIRSAIIPGWGQAYNRKYWKMPIIYAGMGALIYFAYDNNQLYQEHREQYLFRVDDDPNTVDDFPNASDAELLDAVNFYRRNRDLNVIMAFGVYALNIIDATVDAHLFNFNAKINEDLSVRLSPTLQGNIIGPIPIPSLSLSLKLN